MSLGERATALSVSLDLCTVSKSFPRLLLHLSSQQPHSIKNAEVEPSHVASQRIPSLGTDVQTPPPRQTEIAIGGLATFLSSTTSSSTPLHCHRDPTCSIPPHIPSPALYTYVRPITHLILHPLARTTACGWWRAWGALRHGHGGHRGKGRGRRIAPSVWSTGPGDTAGSRLARCAARLWDANCIGITWQATCCRVRCLDPSGTKTTATVSTLWPAASCCSCMRE